FSSTQNGHFLMQKTKGCDVLVVGSGAAGFAAAITAKKRGLDVLLIEKEPYFGGTTALSGGFLWIPANHHEKAAGIADDTDKARRYLRVEAGNAFDADKVDAFLTQGPEMLEFFERETLAKFALAPAFPDYHAERDGGANGGRSIFAEPL